jgi:hypothetical protein
VSIILFNGPPGCGKDTMAEAIWRFRWNLPGSWKFDRMSMPNKKAFAGATATEHRLNSYGINSFWEPIKDTPHPLLGGRTYRNWQQDFSEKFMKPLYGEDIFAKLFAERNHDRILAKDFHFLVPDCGFDIEFRTLRQMYPTVPILVVKIFRDGKDFSSDTRKYLDTRITDDVIVVQNNSGLEDFQRQALELAQGWVERISENAK